jgi:hypothetical protein
LCSKGLRQLSIASRKRAQTGDRTESREHRFVKAALATQSFFCLEQVRKATTALARCAHNLAVYLIRGEPNDAEEGVKELAAA